MTQDLGCSRGDPQDQVRTPKLIFVLRTLEGPDRPPFPAGVGTIPAWALSSLPEALTPRWGKRSQGRLRSPGRFPLRSAPSPAIAGAPVFPCDPPTIPTCPKVPLCEDGGRRGMRDRTDLLGQKMNVGVHLRHKLQGNTNVDHLDVSHFIDGRTQK